MSDEEFSQELTAELSNAEKKLKLLYDRRDHFQEEAKVFREMRDDLHDKRRSILDSMAELKAEKEGLYDQVKEAKSRRDLYNEKVGLLSGTLRRRRDDDRKGQPYEDRITLEIELKKLEKKYETIPSKDLAAERETVKQMDEIRRKLQRILEKEPDRARVIQEFSTAEEEIDGYRQMADREHLRMQELYGRIKEIDVRLKEQYPSINHLRAESDKRHEEYLKAREQADSYHAKATELRERVLQLRQEKRKILNEARSVVDEQNAKVREALEDDDRLDEAADHAVAALMKKGKITL